jgi:hypothetical protein
MVTSSVVMGCVRLEITVYRGQLSGHEQLFPPEDMERWQERDERSYSAQ